METSINTKEAFGGMARGPSGVKIAQITDGLSNTILIVENSARPMQYVQNKPTLNPVTGDLSYNTFFTPDGWAWADINSGISVDGASDTGIINKTNNSGVVTPASPYTCMVNCTNNGEIYSFHAGGVHITLGDGSSRFISKSISNQVLLSLITKDAGDVTGEF